MAQHGGKRPGAGRKPGQITQATRDIAGMAKDLAAEALETLADVMRNGTSDNARVSAANSIIDRGYGKPKEISADADGEAPSLTVNIKANAPIGEIRVTRTDA